MRTLRFALIFLVVEFATIAQTPSASLQGIVVEMGTNTPLSGATLELRSVGDTSRRYPAVSSDNGQFIFRSVPPGQYSFMASRPGYLRAQYGQRGPNGTGEVVTLAAQQRMTGMRVSMMRGSAISGHVFDQDGVPAVNAQLHAWKVSYKNGWRMAVPIVSQMTNDLGEYRLFGLPPGEYYVSAQPEPLLHIHSPAYASMAPLTPGVLATNPTGGVFSAIPDPAFPRPGPRVEWAPTYFGGTTDEYAATPVHVRPGSDVTGVDIVALRTATVTVAGVVVGPDGQPLGPASNAPEPEAFVVVGPNGERVQVRPGGPNSRLGAASVVVTPLVNTMFHASPAITVLGGVMSVAPAMPVRTNAMGQFRLPSLPPGAYTLTAIATDAQGRRLAGQTVVNLQGADPGNITINMAPAWDVEGRILVEGPPGGGAPDFGSLSVRATNTMTALADVTPGAPSASGAFTLRNVTRGNYALTVAPISSLIAPENPAIPAGWQNAYVKSARVGNLDVLENGLSLENPPDGQLEIVIVRNGGALGGVVRDNSRAAVSNVTVALVPDEARRQRFDLYRHVMTDGTGNYRFDGLPPGTYKVFAWEDVELHSWRDPAFMRVYEDLGRAVTVAEGSAQALDLVGISPLER